MSKQLTQLVMALYPFWQVQTSVGRFFDFLKKLWFQFFKIFRNQTTIGSGSLKKNSDKNLRFLLFQQNLKESTVVS
jgi:hypothetical protein